MADFRTTLDSKIADILARFADDDGANVSARVVTNGAEATSIKLNMSARGGKDGAQTSLSASVEAEKDGTTISASGDTATSGGAPSALLELNASLQEKLAVAEVIAKGDGADSTASAGGGLKIVDFQQETVDTPTGNPTMSRTYLEAIPSEPIAPDPLPPSEENGDWLF